MCQHARVVLAPRPTAPAVGRAFTAECLTEWGLGERCADATLVVSELVTNAVVHGRSEVELDLELCPDTLVVRAVDRSPIPPTAGRLDGDADSGRGVAITQALVDRFGVEDHPPGKAVWGEIDLRDSESCGCRCA